MKWIKSATVGAVIASGVALLAIAQPTSARAAEASQKQDATASATGEVRRVDAAAGRVALKHGAISALELPAMTLVYQAAPALLVDISPGDRVRFTAQRQNGVYVVIEISK